MGEEETPAVPTPMRLHQPITTLLIYAHICSYPCAYLFCMLFDIFACPFLFSIPSQGVNHAGFLPPLLQDPQPRSTPTHRTWAIENLRARASLSARALASPQHIPDDTPDCSTSYSTPHHSLRCTSYSTRRSTAHTTARTTGYGTSPQLPGTVWLPQGDSKTPSLSPAP